jgi:hypothetical protein
VIACNCLMRRDNIGEVRTRVLSKGWLDSAAEPPDDAQIVAALKPARRAVSTVSSVEPFREVVRRWVVGACRAARSMLRSPLSTASSAATLPSRAWRQTLWVRVTDGAVALYRDDRHLCTHTRARRPGERITNPEHMPRDARSFFVHDRRWCHAQARAIGAHCEALIDQPLGERVAERVRAAQSALAHNSPRYITVKTILALGADLQPDPGIDTPSAYRATRFTRSAADLVSHVPSDTPALNGAPYRDASGRTLTWHPAWVWTCRAAGRHGVLRLAPVIITVDARSTNARRYSHEGRSLARAGQPPVARPRPIEPQQPSPMLRRRGHTTPGEPRCRE